MSPGQAWCWISYLCISSASHTVEPIEHIEKVLVDCNVDDGGDDSCELLSVLGIRTLLTFLCSKETTSQGDTVTHINPCS